MFKEKADQFLSIAHEFKLGRLPTESRHPQTNNLSHLSQNDLHEAISVMSSIDTAVFRLLREKLPEVRELGLAIGQVHRAGKKVFLSGCGATGRLSLALETIWRYTHKREPEFVTGFMAGGDLALIKSIENFEDYSDYGRRELLELGFSKDDLLIAITEGGETPFVIGTALEAVGQGSIPYFVYCNPDEILKEVATRSREVIENPSIKKLNLTVGPMALSGSTRMQASTIQMAAVGLALELQGATLDNYEARVDALIEAWRGLEKHRLIPYIEREASIYQRGYHLVYRSSDELAISVLTDTTERSPTFSLPPFENILDEDRNHCLCYLSLYNETLTTRAWERLLLRKPRTLEWSDIGDIASYNRLLGFDISEASVIRRARDLGKVSIFDIDYHDGEIKFALGRNRWKFNLSHLPFLEQHLIVKVLLNTHSTLLMGRLGRYEENVMTWVRPSNNKLIDRSIRYIDHLLQSRGIKKTYEEICYVLFEQIETLKHNESIVLKVVSVLTP